MMNLGGYTQAQAEMLRYVFHNGKVGRAQIAEALQVSNLTVINGVKRLLDDGVLAECGTLPSERGRRVTLLSVNPELHYFLSVDIGGHSTKLAVVRFDGSILYREQITHTGRNLRIVYITPELLREKMEALLQAYGKDRFSALCFSISGTVDFASKQSRFCANLTGWNDVDFQKEFGDHFDLPVYLDSSGHCSAIAERQFGKGKGIDDLLFVSVGTSICTGIILGGKVLRGVSGAAGELGHTQIQTPTHHQFNCLCGHTGCLEMHATSAMMRVQARYHYRLRDPGWKVPKDDPELWLKKAYEAGDPPALDTVTEAAQTLGGQIANAANLLNPQRIVLGGGTIHAYPDMVDMVRQQVQENSLSIISQELTVERTALGADSALLGAALLAILDLLKKATEK